MKITGLSRTTKRPFIIKLMIHFAQNDGLFSGKRRLTLHKTTGCFRENDGSLCTKRRVVFGKTTAHFAQNDSFFFDAHATAKTNSTEQQKLSTHHPHVTKGEKVYNHPLSRVRAYAHYSSFCIFAVTSVTDIFVTS